MHRYVDYRREDVGFVAPSPSESTSVVVFIRPEPDFWHLASILDEEKLVTTLNGRTHFVYSTAPGPHRFMVHVTSLGPSYVDADLEGGKLYFVAVNPGSGSDPKGLIPVAPTGEYWPELRAWLDDSWLVEPSATALEWFRVDGSDLLNEQRTREPGAQVRQLKQDQGVEHAP